MSGPKQPVAGLLLVVGTAILTCSALVVDNGTQALAVWQANSFLPRSSPAPPQPVLGPQSFFLPDDGSEISAAQGGSGTAAAADQTTPSGSTDGQFTRRAKAEGIAVARRPASTNPAQPTSHAVVPTLLKTTRRIAVKSESLTDQTKVQGVLKTTAASQKSSEPRVPESPKTTVHPVVSTTGNDKKVTSETTHKQITIRLTSLTTTLHSANTEALKTVTSARTGNKTTVPMPTAPFQPTLSPKPAPAATGIYVIKNGTADCVRASVGLTIIVQNSKTEKAEYLNIDPNATQTSGSCGNWQSTLNITFHGGFIRFTFAKAADVYYVYVIEASLRVPSEGSPYYGIKTVRLFSAPMGSSFKCLSEQTIDMDTNFQLLAVNTQLQAFDIVGDHFGKVEECALDRNKRMIPAAIGFSLAGLLAIFILTCVIYCKKSNRGYDRI